MDNPRMVVDTGIFIQFLRTTIKERTILFQIPNEVELLISAVTLYELMMGATSESKKQDVLKLTADLDVIPFDNNISNKAAEIYHQLRKRNKMIEFRDILLPLLALNMICH